jgi:hypothetical protein
LEEESSTLELLAEVYHFGMESASSASSVSSPSFRVRDAAQNETHNRIKVAYEHLQNDRLDIDLLTIAGRYMLTSHPLGLSRSLFGTNPYLSLKIHYRYGGVQEYRDQLETDRSESDEDSGDQDSALDWHVLLSKIAWSQAGGAIGSSSTLDKIHLKMFDTGLLPNSALAAAKRVNAFMEEAKQNKSVVHLQVDNLNLQMTNALSQFIENVHSLQTLLLHSCERVTCLHSYTLSRAISRAHLKEIDISSCKFDYGYSFDIVLRGCATAYCLRVNCERNDQWTSVVSLLGNPASVINKIHCTLDTSISPITGQLSSSVNVEQVAIDLSTCLSENKHLKKLYICSYDRIPLFEEKLLCDVSSLDSIRNNSNHIIQSINVVCNSDNPTANPPMSAMLKHCLKLNMCPDKGYVIRRKIFCYYFVGEFDVSAFIEMPLSVLSEIMCKIQGDDRQSAIYRLLRLIPELGNVSERNCNNCRKKGRY